MKIKLITCCAVALLATAQAKSIDNAKLSINKQNIKVWTYQNSTNPVVLYKAETHFDVPIEKAAALILDVEQAPRWVPYMGAASKSYLAMTAKASFCCIWCWIFPFL